MYQMTYNWWVVLLRGIVSLLFGLTAFFLPTVTLAVVVSLFGVFSLLDGIFLLVTGVRTREKIHRWWLLITQGLLGIGVGIFAFIAPGAVALALLYLVGAWAIITGVMEIVAAINLRREIKNEWWLGLSGLASVLLGLVLILFPDAGLLLALWWIGVYAVVSGIMLTILSFRLRKEEKRPRTHEIAQ